jgi:non-ribosomal peptide synthetase component F
LGRHAAAQPAAADCRDEADVTTPPFRSALIHHSVAAQAATSPDRTAVEFGDTRLTYAEMWDHARRVSERLRTEGARPDSVVAVAMERSAELPELLMGVP